jgi:hypothetical protein
MISKAEKEKTLVILPIETYETKTQNFIQNIQFEKLNINPTGQYQNVIKQELKKQHFIQK